MSIVTDRIARKANGIGGRANPLDDNAKFYLFEALGSTLDDKTTRLIRQKGRYVSSREL